MRIKFINPSPLLVGAMHYQAGDVVDFHDGLALRLVRGKVAERTTEDLRMISREEPQPPQSPQPPTDGEAETATIKTDLETPESRRDRVGKGKAKP